MWTMQSCFKPYLGNVQYGTNDNCEILGWKWFCDLLQIEYIRNLWSSKNPMWKRDGNAWLHDFHPSDPIVYDCLEITHFFSLLVFCCVDIYVIRSSSLYCNKLLTLLGWLHRPTPCCMQWAHSYCAGSPETWCQDYQSSGTVCNSGQCNLTVMLSRQCWWLYASDILLLKEIYHATPHPWQC